MFFAHFIFGIVYITC